MKRPIILNLDLLGFSFFMVITIIKNVKKGSVYIGSTTKKYFDKLIGN